MKKIISILMCVVVLCVNCIPAFADSLTTSDSDISLYNTQLALYANTDSNGFTLLDHTESVFFGSQITRDGLIYFGNMGGESQVLPSNYSIGARLFTYCRDTKRPNGYYMTGCSVIVYSFDSSLEYLHGEYDNNGNLKVTTPDGSKLFSSMSNYSQDATTGELKVSSGVGSLSAGTFTVSANGSQALFCDLPIRFDDGTVLEPDNEPLYSFTYVSDGYGQGHFLLTSTSDSNDPVTFYFTNIISNGGFGDSLLEHFPFRPDSSFHRFYYPNIDGHSYFVSSSSPLIIPVDEFDFIDNCSWQSNFASTFSAVVFIDNPRQTYSKSLTLSFGDSTDFFPSLPEQDDFVLDDVFSGFFDDLGDIAHQFGYTWDDNPSFDAISSYSIVDLALRFRSFSSWLGSFMSSFSSNLFSYLSRIVADLELSPNPFDFTSLRLTIESIDWHGLIGTGFRDFSLSDILNGIRGIFSDTIIDTDYDLPALVAQLRPLLTDSRFSLPDLTGFLSPALNDLDIRPDGSFGNYLGGISTDLNLHLDSLFGDTQLALGDVNTNLGDLKTELGDIKNEIQVSVGDLSTEINGNIRNTFVPDVDVIKTRVERSETNLTNKFKFVEDIRDDFDDLKQTVENSDDSPPDMSFTLYGKTMYAVDWSMYNRYRSTIHNVFVAIGYILLIKYIYKTLPSTLGEGGD